MAERRSKRHILPDLIFSKFFLIFCVFLFVAVLFFLAKGTIKNHQVNTEVADLEADIIQLTKQNQEFEQLINYLKTDSYIEQEAKLKMGYKKPGENLVIIPQQEMKVAMQPEENINKLSNPAKWWFYFFK
jgi:cell division protein FtsB